LAKSLTDRLIGLDKYEINSIGIKSISIGLGTPEGAKNFKNLTIPCFIIAINVTARNIKKAIAKVTMM
tara:strand:- start:1023 stop:1226 length:204 start_codon:yes stop_codon:yes gene_type:complete